MQEVLKRNSEDSLHTFPFNKPKTNFHEQMEIKKQQKEKSAWLLLFLSNEKTFERERKRKSVRRNPPPSSLLPPPLSSAFSTVTQEIRWEQNIR